MKKTKPKTYQKVFFSRDSVEVKLSPVHRYGVFAKKDISPKEIIEECPVIVSHHPTIASQEELATRAFYWDNEHCSFALGYGMIYNHADQPNASFKINRETKIMKFTANKPISTGAEIFIDYGKGWFATHDDSVKKKLEEKRNSRGLTKVMALLFILLVLSIAFPVRLPINNWLETTSANRSSNKNA